MRKAVFLDRDGVINKLVFNSVTGEYESPHYENDFKMFPWVLSSFKKLQKAGFLLFLISNQPSYAKGKTSLKNIKKIHKIFHHFVSINGISFKRYYYCYHHPNGVKNKYSLKCNCRKPKPYFVLSALKKYKFNPNVSWLIGDRDSDILCGTFAGLKTILIKENLSKKYQISSKPNYSAPNLKEAVKIILKDDKNEKF